MSVRRVLYAVAFAGLAHHAQAAALTASELAMDQGLLSGFNAIAFGNYTQNSETEGSALIGGNLTGGKSGDFCFQNCRLNPVVGGIGYASLTVFGTASGTNGTGASGANIAIGNAAGGVLGAATSTSYIQENHNGGVSIVGHITGTLDSVQSLATTAAGGFRFQNPPSAQSYHLLAATVFPYGSSIAPVRQALGDLASAAATLDQQLIGQGKGETLPTPQNAQNHSFSPTANYSGADGLSYAIIDSPTTSIESMVNWQGINGAGLAAVIVVIDATGNVSLPALNGPPSTGNVIWDFPDANSVTTQGSWYGTILAPNATFGNGGIIDGNVIADSIIQGNEFHGDLAWTGNLAGLPTGGGTTAGGLPVPEPASLSLFGLGAAGLAFIRRRRRRG